VHIEIDLGTVPPLVTLEDPKDFTAFKVVVRDREHAWVDAEQLVALAGELGASTAWLHELQCMLDFAREHGWMRDDGSIRGHVERAR
jgi:hypothetical protein